MYASGRGGGKANTRGRVRTQLKVDKRSGASAPFKHLFSFDK